MRELTMHDALGCLAEESLIDIVERVLPVADDDERFHAARFGHLLERSTG